MMATRILIADEDIKFVVALTQVLEREGYMALTALDSLETLQQVKEHQPHLLLLSESLTGATDASHGGIEICQTLRHDPMYAFCESILILGFHTNNDSVINALESGADDYLSKPFGMNEFVARVGALLRRGKNVMNTVLEPQNIKHFSPSIYSLEPAVEAPYLLE